MPTVAVKQSVAANSTATPLTGSQYEYAPWPCLVEFAIQADATGVLATIVTGSDVIQEEAPVQLGTINVQPKYPDDFFQNDVVMAGERIKITLRDTSGATRTVQVVVRLTPAF